ncbi:MAG: S41 family peptidase [Thermoanaerobaculia bacterium]
MSSRPSLRPLLAAAIAALLLSAAPGLADADGPPEARLLRFPDVRGDDVVFVYGGDLWRVPLSGGAAFRLTSHPGLELFPKLSHDGKWIAFSAEYTGTRQVWVMPARGGTPRQLTFATDVGPMPPRGGWDNWVLGWTKDGKVLVRMNRVPWNNRMGRYYLVDPKGGLETPLEIPEGGSASLSPDGTKLAYCPVDREFRTWKRTKGGRAQDVWTYDFAAKRSERLTTWEGTDNFPMWWGDAIFFTSDRERTLNLWRHDLKSRETRKLTSFTEFDVLWPSLGDGKIVFMNGGDLWTLDLATEKAARISVRLGTDASATVPAFRDVSGNVSGMAISPSGARAVVDARGDLYTIPAKDGVTRPLTAGSAIRERDPAWSPDGAWIAYLSDETGEYDLWIRPQDGSGAPRRLTTDGAPWKYAPAFSPDGKRIAFGDRAQRLRVVDVASGKVSEIDRSAFEDIDVYSFSPDSRWLVYEKSHATRLPGLWAAPLEGGKPFPLGDGLTADFSPAFSADGKFLFFLSNRDYAPTFSAFEFSYVYPRATRVYVAALTPDASHLFPPKSDEEKGKAGEKEGAEKTASGTPDGKKDGKKDDTKAAKAAEPPRVTILPEGFAARTIALPGVKSGDLRSLRATEEAVYYVRDVDGEGGLFRFDLKDRKEEKVLDGIAAYRLSADGKKLLWKAGRELGIAEARAGLASGAGKLDLSGLRARLDLPAEWAQIWRDGARIVRDWFYDPGLHGVDWNALVARYGALVPHVAHRADLDFLLGELVSELEAGHTYVTAGDEPKVERFPGGFLGCELAADPSGRYRITRIFPGENWDEPFRSPLTEPGSNVAEGELLLAIDGVDLTTADNPYRLLEGKAGRPVTLLVGRSPAREGARTVTVRTVASEQGLRYLDWVKSRMALVEKLSGGKVGYIHLPDTALAGNRMLQKLFYSQVSKPALLVDDRYNGGGFIPDRMIEMLSRTTLAFWARRGVDAMRTPGFAHDGPKAMLVNSYSASGGDALPYFFRKQKLGPIVGTRTWGGLIGLSGNAEFVDGGSVDVPTFRIYDHDGKWVVENEGVAPDVEVFDVAERRLDGGDPSLEKGVEILLQELAKRPAQRPTPPVPPRLTD